MSTKNLSQGFTLVEMLVALALLAVLSGLVFQTFRLQTNFHQRINDDQQKLVDLARAWQLVGRDISHLVPRKVRDDYGDHQPALSFGSRQELQLSTLSWFSDLAYGTGEVQRVRYTLDQQTQSLWRHGQMYPDTVATTPRQSYVILTEVKTFGVRFMDKDLGWHDAWPTPRKPEAILPVLIEVIIETNKHGVISRLFPVVQIP